VAHGTTGWKVPEKGTGRNGETGHKERLRRWLTSRPVGFPSAFGQARKSPCSHAVSLPFPPRLPETRRGNESLPPLSKRRIGAGRRTRESADRKSRGTRDRETERERERERKSGPSRFAESEAYISAGTNCPIIHSVQRQRCSFAYPRPFLPPFFRGLFFVLPRRPAGFCLAYSRKHDR